MRLLGKFKNLYYYIIAYISKWELIAGFAEGFIVMRFCNKFLGFKNKRLSRLKSAAFFLVLSMCTIYFTINAHRRFLAVVLLFGIIMFYCVIFLKGTFLEKLFAAVIPVITTILTSLICIKTFSIIADKSQWSGYVLFSSKFGLFIVCEIILKLKKKSFSLSPSQWILPLSCYTITFIIATVLWRISASDFNNEQEYLIVFIFLALLNIMLYFMVLVFQKGADEKAAKAALQSELDNRKMMVSEFEKRYSEMKILRHDMKHYISTAATLISENQSQKAKAYLEEVLQDKILGTGGTIFTGNSIVDAVLSEKQTQCVNKGIEFKVQIDTEFGSISELDISVILANLIDNAIKGSVNSEIPSIVILVKRAKAYLKIEIKNSLGSSVLNQNPNLETTQSDNDIHGLGIRSVKDIAEKYEGKVMFSEYEKTFSAVVILKAEAEKIDQ